MKSIRFLLRILLLAAFLPACAAGAGLGGGGGSGVGLSGSGASPNSLGGAAGAGGSNPANPGGDPAAAAGNPDGFGPKGDIEPAEPVSTGSENWRFCIGSGYTSCTKSATPPAVPTLHDYGTGIDMSVRVEAFSKDSVGATGTWKPENAGGLVRLVLVPPNTETSAPGYCDTTLTDLQADGSNLNLAQLSVYAAGNISLYFMGTDVSESMGASSDCSQGFISFPDGVYNFLTANMGPSSSRSMGLFHVIAGSARFHMPPAPPPPPGSLQ